MPYFVYRVAALGPVRRLESLGVYAAYAEAAAACRNHRESGEATSGQVRMIFAQNELQAEELLHEARAPEPNIADDY